MYLSRKISYKITCNFCYLLFCIILFIGRWLEQVIFLFILHTKKVKYIPGSQKYHRYAYDFSSPNLMCSTKCRNNRQQWRARAMSMWTQTGNTSNISIKVWHSEYWYLGLVQWDIRLNPCPVEPVSLIGTCSRPDYSIPDPAPFLLTGKVVKDGPNPWESTPTWETQKTSCLPM